MCKNSKRGQGAELDFCTLTSLSISGCTELFTQTESEGVSNDSWWYIPGTVAMAVGAKPGGDGDVACTEEPLAMPFAEDEEGAAIAGNVLQSWQVPGSIGVAGLTPCT